MTPLTRRQQVIAELAERHDELVATLHHTGIDGNGETLALMPATYTESVRELEHWLRTMRDDRTAPLLWLQDGTRASLRQLRWHVMHWYVWSQPRAAEAVLVHTKSGHTRPLVDHTGRPLRPRKDSHILRFPNGQPHTVRVRYRERSGNQAFAEHGIRWIERQFRLEPELPRQLREAA